VKNRGFWALEAPPKREKQMIHRGLFIGWRVTGECVRTHQLFVVERRVHVRPQITAMAARADWACVRPQFPCVRTQITARAGWVLRATVASACDRECVRTHQVRSNALWQDFHFKSTFLPFASHVCCNDLHNTKY
jgi:hypothetical protein